MASYRYQNGDRPLDGYTIEYGVGRGGFGEVYYAVSDSGRQVALKAVQNYEDIELRGNSHCMNLKSPHLVSIFDVKFSDRGDPFVIMEFVSGPSLRDLLDDSSEGLGPEKSAWFVREIAKGLALLHDNGIVHRDLKPHNVFFEDGYVKVGDYSLSKVITTSHRSGHTLSVGTVHYMAPEIGIGRYDRTVDIYALGVLLYEMLTGRPPHIGETMGEVLMKHMSGEIDTSNLDEPFAVVVRKAMAKDPKDRYQSVEEMVADLLGTEDVRNGLDAFSPQSLTFVARRETQAVIPTRGTPPRSSGHPAAPVSRLKDQAGDRARSRSRSIRSRNPKRESTAWNMGRLIAKLAAFTGVMPARILEKRPKSADPLPLPLRIALCGVCVLLMAWATDSLGSRHDFDPDRFGDEDTWAIFFIMVFMGGGALFASRWLTRPMLSLPWFIVRILMGVLGLIPAIVLAAEAHPCREPEPTIIAAFFTFLFVDWRWLTAPIRPDRIHLGPVLTCGFFALFVSAFCDGDAFYSMGIAAGAALGVQVLAAFDPVGSRKMSRMTSWPGSFMDTVTAWYREQFPDIAEELDALDNPRQQVSESVLAAQAAVERADPRPKIPRDAARSSEPSSQSPFLPTSWSDDSLGNQPQENVQSDVGSSSESTDDDRPSRLAALILCLLPLVTFGMVPCGLHRFTTGKVGTGIIWLVTFGFFGIGQLIDLVLIALGEFRDGTGRVLRTGQTNQIVGMEQVNGLSAVPLSSSLFSNGLAILGGLGLVVGILLGAFLAIDVPEMIAQDVFKSFDLTGSDFESVFGVKNWPDLLWEMVALFAGIIGVLSAGLLITSRRRFGLAHMFRVLLAAPPMVGTFAILSEAFWRHRWADIVAGFENGQIGPLLESLFGRGDFVPCMIGASVTFTVSLLILSWPPQQQGIRTTASAKQTRVTQGV